MEKLKYYLKIENNKIMAFKIHKMYHKNGDVETADTKKEHNALKQRGYNHDKRRKT